MPQKDALYVDLLWSLILYTSVVGTCQNLTKKWGNVVRSGVTICRPYAPRG